MSDYIDPRTKPWSYETDEIWEYMKATWEASVPTHLVPDTEAKRIREYKAITQWWKQKYRPCGYTFYVNDPFLQWLRKEYNEHKVNPFDHQGCPPRFNYKQHLPF